MNLIIDRAKWLRGEGSGESFLIRNTDGKMCCLGFLGLACEIPQEKLMGAKSPVSYYNGSLLDKTSRAPKEDWVRLNKEVEGIFGPPCTFLGEASNRFDISEVCAAMMKVNDSNRMSDSVREETLRDLFRSTGIQVEFVG